MSSADGGHPPRPPLNINAQIRCSHLLANWYCQLSFPDDGPVYHALSVHLSPAKLTARSRNDVPWRNFLSPDFGAIVPEGNRLPLCLDNF